MKFLILTGRFGMGHVSAAQCIQQDIHDNIPGASAEIIDIINYALPHLSNKIYQSFSWMAKSNPYLYNLVYNAFDEKTNSLMNRIFHRKIHTLIETKEPTMIISTLHICSQFISAYKRKQNNTIPLVTYITDISCSDEWINSGTDLFVVATDDVRDGLISKGIAAHQILVCGIPVNTQFMDCSKENDSMQCLMMGGGLGLLPENMAFYQQLEHHLDADFTLITGKNHALYQSLKRRFNSFIIMGYTHNIPQYMNTADLLISKAGGITLFEAIHSSTPLVVPKPTLAQEINNAHYIERNGIGLVAWNGETQLLEIIHDLMYDKTSYTQMKQNMVKLRNQMNNQPMRNVLKHITCSEAV